jgi:hypothetical protein
MRSELSDFGVEVSLGFASFDIDESISSWKSLQHKILEWGAVDVATTQFTSTELSEASFLKVDPAWHWGYPQPETKRGYLAATYKAECFCPLCGCGAIQVAPFKIKSEPQWRKKQVLQLNWIFDVFFCLPDVWQNIFKSFGIPLMEVQEYQSSKKLKSIVQLIPQGVVAYGSQLELYPCNICARCGEKKFLPITRGFFPRISHETPMHYFMSEEWFGSGASGFHAIFISQHLYRSILNAKLTGMIFTPMCPTA